LLLLLLVTGPSACAGHTDSGGVRLSVHRVKLSGQDLTNTRRVVMTVDVKLSNGANVTNSFSTSDTLNVQVDLIDCPYVTDPAFPPIHGVEVKIFLVNEKQGVDASNSVQGWNYLNFGFRPLITKEIVHVTPPRALTGPPLSDFSVPIPAIGSFGSLFKNFPFFGNFVVDPVAGNFTNPAPKPGRCILRVETLFWLSNGPGGLFNWIIDGAVTDVPIFVEQTATVPLLSTSVAAVVTPPINNFPFNDVIVLTPDPNIPPDLDLQVSVLALAAPAGTPTPPNPATPKEIFIRRDPSGTGFLVSPAATGKFHKGLYLRVTPSVAPPPPGIPAGTTVGALLLGFAGRNIAGPTPSDCAIGAIAQPLDPRNGVGQFRVDNTGTVLVALDISSVGAAMELFHLPSVSQILGVGLTDPSAAGLAGFQNREGFLDTPLKITRV
jgi:hypothetical protein